MKRTRMLAILVLALGLTAEVANADFIFGEPTNLGPTVNSAYQELNLCISFDGLSLYFTTDRPGGFGGRDIWITELQTTRQMTELVWGTPINLGPTVNSSAEDSDPSISADGLELYISSHRFGGLGDRDVWVSTRATRDAPWGTPLNMGPNVNSSSLDHSPSISGDGLSLFFASERAGGSGTSDLWLSTRATTDDDWGTPVNLGPTVNGPTSDSHPSISADGLCLFFSDRVAEPYRKGGLGASDIWMTTRPTTDEPWGPPENLGPIINGPAGDRSPCISADGSTLYFHSTGGREGFGQHDIYQASIIPIVDLNGDGIVDSADMCIMVDHWGENYSLCDIGPTPLGDGIVDVHDLIVLAEHLFEEIPPVE